MALTPGTRLGPYEVLAPAGAGGMGEVYRASDTRLGRTVALKVLPHHLLNNAQSRQRFEREARTISGLSHPNICALYDVGQHDGTDYLVMEYLEGETLAAKLEKGALPLPQAMRIATEIATALAEAHRRGVIHRDLKPGNVMLTRIGAKLLDFGLAKPADSVLTASTMAASAKASPLTGQGTILGTVSYMAPEQLEGKQVDARADIFALGALIYEMVTGRRAFEGASQASVIAAILEREPPPMASLQPMVSPGLDRLVRTCLVKDPDERWQTIHDVLLELKWSTEAGSQVGAAMPAVARPSLRLFVAWALAGVFLITTGVLATLLLQTRPADAPILRASIPPPPGARFIIGGEAAGPPTLSPDGRLLAFVAVPEGGPARIWVQGLNELSAKPLSGTEGASFPFWSPDGRSLGFFAEGKLKRIDLDGGPPLTLCDAPFGRGGTWSPKGILVFSGRFRAGLSQIPAIGGTPTEVTKLDPSKHTTHRWPHFLPDGEHFLYLAANHTLPEGEHTGLYFTSLGQGQGRFLLPTSTDATYASGYLLYMRQDALLAQKFDAEAGQLVGEPIPTAEAVLNAATIWKAIFTASQTGIFVYHPAVRAATSGPTWYDRSGTELGEVMRHADDFREHFNVRFSPDGQRLAAEDQDSPTSDIWIYELARGTRSRLTFSTANDTRPVWSPDGKRVFFSSNRIDGKYQVFEAASEGGAEQRLLFSTTEESWPTDVSPDGRFLMYFEGDLESRPRGDLWAFDLTGAGKAFPILNSSFTERDGQFSPDGRWIAYSSKETGREEVFVVPFTGGLRPGADQRRTSGKWQVSTSGGSRPRWNPRGGELFFVGADNSLMAADIRSSAREVVVTNVRPLFRLKTNPNPAYYCYDISPDGKRFVAIPLGAGKASTLALVVNWSADLKK